MDEAQSRRIAGLLGPTIIVMIVSEFPLVQPRLYDAQIPPVVYLSGLLMFVAGLAKSLNRMRCEVSQRDFVSVARIAFQACSFIRLRSRLNSTASSGEMSRRSGQSRAGGQPLGHLSL